MMRIILIAIMILIIQNSYGQQLEVYGCANMNRYFDVYGYAGHFIRDYQTDYGYSIGTAINSGNLSKVNTRFAMQFDYYQGTVIASGGSNGSGYSTKASFKKSVLSFMFSPLNYKVLNKVELNLSPVFSLLVDESFSGIKSGWEMYEGGWRYDLSEVYDEYSKKFYFGLQARIAYELKLSNKISVTPQYLYYLGLSNEFIEFPFITKSMRFYLGAAVKMNL